MKLSTNLSKHLLGAIDKLDQYQTAVVEYDQQNQTYLSVEAGAGSGKSTTMTVLAQSHIEAGVYPRNIVMTTFSKSSVIDLQHKYKKMFPQQILQPTISTLHRLGLVILKEQFSDFKKVKIKTSGYSIMADVLLELNFLDPDVLPQEKHGQLIMQMLDHVEAYQSNNVSSPFDVDTSVDIFEIVSDPSSLFELDEFYEVMEAYTNKKFEDNIITFSDMLYLSYWFLKEDPEALARVQAKVDVLICDEAQDMDTIQFDFLELIIKGNSNIKTVAVYDYLQTLYKFRYATPARLVGWAKNSHGLFTETKTLPLVMNYRSDANIVKANNMLRKSGGQLESTPFRDTAGRTAIEFKTCYVNILEGNEIVNTVKDLVENQGYKYSDIAVIIRTNKFLKEIVEPAIIKADLPYKTINDSTGAKLLDRELSDYLFNALSLYRDNNDGVALIAILSLLYGENEQMRGQIETLANRLQNSKKKDLKEALLQIMNRNGNHTVRKALEVYQEIAEYKPEANVLMVNLLHAFTITLASWVKEDRLDRAILREDTQVINSIVNMVSQIAHDKRVTKLNDLIELAIEVVETYKGDATENCIAIGSIHSTKGLEFPVTISAGFTAGKEVQDTDGDFLEKFYVQVSRAIDRSILIGSLQFQSFGDESKILSDDGFIEGKIFPYFKEYRNYCLKAGVAMKSGLTIL